MDDTIVQLSTPRVASAVHVIRFSGSESKSFFIRHTRLKVIQPKKVYPTTFYEDDKGKVPIDYVIGFFFNSPYSFTGEDVLELHVHGSLYIVDQILHIANSERCRLAKAGEFTYRAFLNGKLQLHQAEAVDALIHSRNQLQRYNALGILEGRLSFSFKDLNNHITSMLAELESSIEYPEEDIPLVTTDKKQLYQNYLKQIDDISKYFFQVLKNYNVGKKLADGFKVMIIGSPNSGKSTLFNLLLNENRSIVSSTQGTTRDYIVERLVLQLPIQFKSDWDNTIELVLHDTAGIHDQPEQVEFEGISKVVELVPEMDLMIWVISDVNSYEEFMNSKIGGKIINQIKNNGEPVDKEFAMKLLNKLWVIINKEDLLDEEGKVDLKNKVNADFESMYSVLGNQDTSIIKGLVSLTHKPEQAKELLYTLLRDWVQNNYRFNQESIALLNERQALVTEKILQSLMDIRAKIVLQENEEIIVTEFKKIEHLFGELSLDTGLEEVYDTLFSKFCIGK